MKSTLFYQDFPNLPRTIHRSILSSLPSVDCQSSFSRVLNLGLRRKNKLTQGILFGNIQELAAAFQLCWPYSLSLRKDSLDEWAGTCPCLFPNKWPNFQVQAHYSPGAQKFHLQRGFHWITLNSFRKKIKINLFYKSPLPPTEQGLRWAWNSPFANKSTVSKCRHQHLCTKQEGQSRSRVRTSKQEGSHQDSAAAQAFCKHVLQRPEHLRSRALCCTLSLI